LNTIDICANSSTASSVTLVCNLGNRSGNIYTYWFYGKFAGDYDTYWTFEKGILDYSTLFNYGATGLFITLLVVILLAMLAIWDYTLTIVGSILAIIMSYYLGWLQITGGWAMIPFIIISAGVLIWRLKSR
jgi:hypothetical protein